MKLRHVFLTVGLATLAGPANAAISVIGNSFARTCYTAAENRASSLDAVLDCDEALRTENLPLNDMVATHVNRGILKLRRGDVEEAVADFDRAIDLDPGEADAYLNKGVALLRLSGDGDQAAGLFSTALAKKTRKPAVAYYGRGIANELKGRIADAYYDYRQASILEPKWRDPKSELARFTVRQR